MIVGQEKPEQVLRKRRTPRKIQLFIPNNTGLIQGHMPMFEKNLKK